MSRARIVRSSEGTTYPGSPWVFKIGATTGGTFDFMVGAVEYLTGPPLHVHREQHDTFYVLEGVLAVQIDDEVFDIERGDFATVPPGVRHTFDNIRRDQPPVGVLNLMTPAGLDGFMAEVGELGQDPPGPAVERIGDNHGVRFIGPPLRVRLGLGTT